MAKKPENTGKSVASLAARGLKDPASLTNAEIKKIAASALTQAPDKPAPRPKKRPK